MKKLIPTIAVSVLLTAFSNLANASLIVTQTNDAEALANILVNGSNVTTANQTATGASSAFGTFTGGVSAGIGIESGIIISTGSVSDAAGPNSVDQVSTINGSAGTALLPGSTRDAAILTFDFITTTGSFFFNYVFASDEYNEFVGSSFNDVFGFIFDNVNIAKVPGTSDDVSISTVNLITNSQFFNNNDENLNPSPFNIAYDGFTDVFQASFTGLDAGTYTMSLAIADVGDSSFDSAVFIEAGSFTDSVDVSAPPTLAILGLSLLVWAARRTSKK